MGLFMKFISISDPPAQSNFNVYRKVYHLLGLGVPILFYLNAFDPFGPGLAHPTRAIGFCILAVGICMLLLIDIGRFSSVRFRKVFYNVLGSLMKEEERNRINASVPYFTANLILFALCGREVTVVACIFLMIGDPVAAYVGGKYGRIRFWNGKSLEGMLGFALAGTLGAILFLELHSLATPIDDPFQLHGANGFRFDLVLLVFMGAVVAGTFEFFAFNRFKGFWDDNLTVPLGGAAGLTCFAYYLFGVPKDVLFFDPTLLFEPATAAAALLF